jgi:hypothetical protein
MSRFIIEINCSVFVKRFILFRNHDLELEVVFEAVVENKDEDDGAEESRSPLEDLENSDETFSNLHRLGNRVSVLSRRHQIKARVELLSR